MNRPNVSIITPTYNREIYLENLFHIINNQTYPLDKIEWIIYDDGNNAKKNYIKYLNHPLQYKLKFLHYIPSSVKLNIGTKRNLCKMYATSDYLIHMDDDDYYSNHYIHSIIQIFSQNLTHQVIGSSIIYIVNKNNPYLQKWGPLNEYHTCAGLLSYTKDYANNNHFGNTTNGEERLFLKNYTQPIFQLSNVHQYNIVLNHGTNTFDKSNLQTISTDYLFFQQIHNCQKYNIRQFYWNIYGYYHYTMIIKEYQKFGKQIINNQQNLVLQHAINDQTYEFINMCFILLLKHILHQNNNNNNNYN